MPNKKRKSGAGFTLIELLIVVTIIAVLSLVGLTSYTNFLKNSRDAKRQSDLKFIQSALEQYFADQKHYPFAVYDPADGSLKYGDRTYLTKVPSDPKGTPYGYSASGSGCSSSSPQFCNNYCLSTTLENLTLTSECTPTGGNNYGVSKP